MPKYRITLNGKGVDSQKTYMRNIVPRVGEVVVSTDKLNDEHEYEVITVVHNFCCEVGGQDAEISLEVTPRK